MTEPRTSGIHHVSAIASDAHRNLEFYAGILGLRLVKQAVNFDDPGVYHLYYGDGHATPGSLLTFFVWPQSNRGQQGVGQVAVVSLAVHPESIAFWVERFVARGIAFTGPRKPSGDEISTAAIIEFRDPDGLMLQLVPDPTASHRDGWNGTHDIPPKHAIRGLHSVTIWAKSPAPSNQILVNTLGFHKVAEAGTSERLVTGEGHATEIVDVRTVGGFVQGREGAGTVHHVAWAAADTSTLAALRTDFLASGFETSEIVDRTYFHAIYVREPDGVLHEVATISPGFAVDEDLDHLGEQLAIPPGLEWQRSLIEARLPALHVPGPIDASRFFADQVGADPRDEYVHAYLPASAGSPLTLVALHGTGGDEQSLLPIAREVAPLAAIISPRGKVLEGAAPRFFRRIAEGVLDQKDLEFRTHELATWIATIADEYGRDASSLIAFGFSNGANIAASLLLRRPSLLRGAILLSPMLPFEPATLPDLAGVSVFIGAGRNDPIVDPADVDRLAEILADSGARVTVHWENGGHTITTTELTAAREWLNGPATS